MLKNTNWKYNAPIKSKVFLIIDISEIDQNGAIYLIQHVYYYCMYRYAFALHQESWPMIYFMQTITIIEILVFKLSMILKIIKDHCPGFSQTIMQLAFKKYMLG